MCAVDLLTGLPSSLPPPLCYIPLSVREEEVLLLTLSKGASLASAIVLSPICCTRGICCAHAHNSPDRVADMGARASDMVWVLCKL